MTHDTPRGNWQAVASTEKAHAKHLRVIADYLSTELKGETLRVAQWIDDQIDAGKTFSDPSLQTAALADPQVLAVLSPILQQHEPIAPVTNSSNGSQSHQSGELSEPESRLVANLQTGVARLAKNVHRQSSLLSLFVFPGFLALGGMGVLLFYCFQISNHFEKLFDEFGIDLPVISRIALGACAVVRNGWPLCVPLAILLIMPFAIETIRRTGRMKQIVHWIDRWLSNKRLDCAAWAQHTALLLQTGLSQQQAIKTSLDSAKPWMSNRPWPWRFGLLKEITDLRSTQSQIALLEQTAVYYRIRETTRYQWWASFIPNLMICFFVASVLFLLIGSFLPLLAILRGLRGLTFMPGGWWF